MHENFDIAIGKCESADDNAVVILLDTAMVSRLVPGHPWCMSGTSKLKLAARLCSDLRPPRVGEETFLDRDAVLKNPSGHLDLLGDGQYTSIRLKALAANTDPQQVIPKATVSWNARPSRQKPL